MEDEEKPENNSAATGTLHDTKWQPGQSGNPLGRPRGSRNRVTIEAKRAASEIVDDPEYRRSLYERAIAGTLAPAIEALLWYYSKGKPVDYISVQGKIAVTAHQLGRLSMADLMRARELATRQLNGMSQLASPLNPTELSELQSLRARALLEGTVGDDES